MRDYLVTRGLSEVHDGIHGSYKATFYLCDEPEKAENIWWVKQFAGMIPAERIADIVNYTFYGAAFFSSDGACYAIPLGKTHFYLREYAEPDFGVELACRIADEKSVRVVNTRSFGSKKTKSIDTFSADSELFVDSGESLDYLAAEMLDKDKWGKSGSFGTSAQVSLATPPENIEQLLDAVEAALGEPARFEPPRAVLVKSKETQAELNAEVATALTGATGTGDPVDVAAVRLHGIEFIFQNVQRYVVKGPGRGIESEIVDELDLDFLRAYAAENGFDLADKWKDLNIQYMDGEGRAKYAEKFAYIISFVTARDGKFYFLRDGKWFEFSQRYVENLLGSVRELELVGWDAIYDLSDAAFRAWQAAQPAGTVKYQEYWYNGNVLSNTSSGMISYDRKFIAPEGRSEYTLEPLDVYDAAEERFIFVKRWKANSDFAYLIDQAVASIQLLGPRNEIEVNGDILRCSRAQLLVIRSGSRVDRLEDIESLIVLQKLNAFKAECRRKDIRPEVRVQYEVS